MTIQVQTIESVISAQKAVETMAQRNIGSLIVVDDSEVTGVLTERDLLRHLSNGVDFTKLMVSDIMTKKVISADSETSIYDATKILEKNHFRRLPIIEKNRLIGIVTATDLTFEIDYSGLKGKVSDYMSKNIRSISKDDNVLKAVTSMIGKTIGCLLVEDAGKTVGIITERDILRNIIAKRKNPQKELVGNNMSSQLIKIDCETELGNACHLMHYYGFRRFPIVSADDKIIGMLTERDLLRSILDTVK